MDQNNEFPEEAVKKLGKLGWMGIHYPKEYGLSLIHICAQAALAEAGIKLYGGVSGDADAAVSALLNGSLGYDPNVHCDHHDHEHGEAGHSCGDHGCGKHSCH